MPPSDPDGALADVLDGLRGWRPPPEELPSFEGAVDPHRSRDGLLLFASDPCGGPWIRIPAEAVASIRQLGEARCGALVLPRVRLELDPEAPAAFTVADALRAATLDGGQEGGGALLQDEEDETASHHVSLELRPAGKLYRTRLQVEGHEVRSMEWDSERKVYTAEIPGLMVEDALDVHLQAWGNDGASLTLSVEVDGRVLEPPLEANITRGPGEARTSYRL